MCRPDNHLCEVEDRNIQPKGVENHGELHGKKAVGGESATSVNGSFKPALRLTHGLHFASGKEHKA
jgi:hypothetical protein